MQTQLLDAIGDLYDSVMDESLWSAALQKVIEFSGGTALGHFTVSSLGGIQSAHTINVDPRCVAQYAQHYGARDVRLPPALKAPVGHVMTEASLIDQRELERSEIYNDLLVPADVPHFMFAWLRKSDACAETLVIEGSRRGGAFDSNAIERYQLLVPHLMRALRSRDHLKRLQQPRDALLQVAQAFPVGVAFIDACGRVRDMTNPMVEILRRSRGFGVRRGQFFTNNPADQQRLLKAIAAAVGQCQGVPGASLTVRRVAPQPPLSVTVLPIKTSAWCIPEKQTIAMVLISDPQLAFQPPISLIRDALALTPSEAELAGALCEGISLRAAATTLGRSINTCKTQLKSIYAKTGSRSHVDLVKLLVLSTMTRARSLSPAQTETQPFRPHTRNARQPLG